jgi:hypothetical protein
MAFLLSVPVISMVVTTTNLTKRYLPFKYKRTRKIFRAFVVRFYNT